MTIGVAINYFARPEHPPSVLLSAQLALTLLASCPEVETRVLVDGSAHPNADLADSARQHGAIYHHAGRELGFGEAYNLGVSMLTEPWIATMASDIFVFPDTFTRFTQFIEAHPELPIGCLVPYLSWSDLEVQEGPGHGERVECATPLMTLNLNLFPSTVFHEIGGIPTYLSGCYNDVEISLALRRQGLKTYLVDAFVNHYGRMTVSHGTGVAWEQDRDLFFGGHPELRRDGGVWHLALEHLLEHPWPRWQSRIGARRGSLRMQERALENELRMGRV